MITQREFRANFLPQDEQHEGVPRLEVQHVFMEFHVVPALNGGHDRQHRLGNTATSFDAG